MRRMMKQIQEQQGAEGETPQEMTDMFKQDLEINPRHALLHKLDATRENNQDLARTVAEQLYDNAMIAAGLMEDPRAMLKRLDDLMEKALEK
jgi:HSP90 family molecular chaperone